MSDAVAPAAQVHAIAGWRYALLWPFGVLLRVWARTLRFDADDNFVRLMGMMDEPLVFALWHNRLFVAGEVYRRYRRGKQIYALVSASKDGAWLAAFFETLGMKTVRGSSSRFGREALHALVAQSRAGHDIGITPDGPRGPCYEFKGGSLLVARRAEVATVLFGAEFSRAWRTRSWDGFYIPLPFSRVKFVAERIAPAALADGEAAQVELRRRLIALNPDHQPHPRPPTAAA